MGNKAAIKAGVGDLGNGFGLLADAIGACHLQEVADLLAQLAAKLGIAPEISWIEEVLHILIESVDIVKEVSGACDGFAADNWPQFGYNLAELIYTLVK